MQQRGAGGGRGGQDGPGAGGALPSQGQGVHTVHGEALAVPGPHLAGHPAQGDHLLPALGGRHLK